MPLAWPGRLTVLLLAVAFCLLFLITGADRVGGEHHRVHRHYVVNNTPLQNPLQILNPWLSACDVAHPAKAPDLQGPCSAATSETSPHALRNTRGAGALSPSTLHLAGTAHEAKSTGPGSGPGCPKPCALNSLQNQCLHYLQESHKDSVCKSASREVLAGLRLRYCCEHTALSALHPKALQAVLQGGQPCHTYIKAVLEVDTLAARLTCEFGEILKRFDCDHPYSMDFGCADCQEAYRQWVCDSLVPHFPVPGGPRQRPCRSVCQTVEQRCPFFLPADRWPNLATQYAGEPTFLCIDPNIPETEAQRNNSLYGDRDCCYNHCDTPERGICPAMNCVDSTSAGNEYHCSPPTTSTPTSPTDRSASPATTCVATSGGPTPPARNGSSPDRALVIVVLLCLVTLQALLVQHIAVVARRGLTLSLRHVTRTLRHVATALCATLVRCCVWIVGILRQDRFSSTSTCCPSASEFKIMTRSKPIFTRPLLKFFIETLLLDELKADTRTTTGVTPTSLSVVLDQLCELDFD